MSVTSSVKPNYKAYPETTGKGLLEACGILPQWLVKFNMMQQLGMLEFKELKQYMTDCYGFGKLHAFQGHVDPDTKDYISKYEDDEPLAHYVSIPMKDGREALIYPYAIVALPTPEGYFITRMD